MILVSYDGSSNAQAAIAATARLAPGAQVTVISVWEPFLDVLARTGSLGLSAGMSAAGGESQEVDAAYEAAADASAKQGAAFAQAAGLEAVGHSQRGRSGVANALMEAAAELDATAIVVGTRGLSGLKSLLLGSVSHALVHHADRPVLVVPAPEPVASDDGN